MGDSTLGPHDSRGDWDGPVGGRPPGPAEGGGAFSGGIPVGDCGRDRGCGSLSGGSAPGPDGIGGDLGGGGPLGRCGRRDPNGADPGRGSTPGSGGDRGRDGLAEGGCRLR